MNTAQAPLSRDLLIAQYFAGGAEEADWLIGGEFERHLLGPDGLPLPYFGDHGIAWLLEELAQRLNWERYYEGDNVIALHGDGASVTLEPGGQFELSGAPFKKIEDLQGESQRFTKLVNEIITQAAAPIEQIALGFTPYAVVPDIGWMPKARYVIMREHLAKTGKLAHYMMKGTAAVQATFDFSDEEDCARKVQLSTSMGPLLTAMFANSPYREGKQSGFMSFRGHIWTQTDPARTGFPEAAADFSYERWVDYLIDVPMMFTRHEGSWRAAHGRSFRSWMTDGIDGVFPDQDDWDLHLTSVFPEVRVKHGIEVRGADCVSMPMALAFVALFKGLFYCGRATREARELLAEFRTVGTKEERFAVAVRDGLRGTIGDRTTGDWAEALVQVTWEGLGRCSPTEQHLLKPLVDHVQRRSTPARDLLDLLGPEPELSALVDATRF